MKVFFLIILLLFGIISVSAQYKSLHSGLKKNNYTPYLFHLNKSVSLENSSDLINKNLQTSNSSEILQQSPDLELFGNIGNNILNSFKGDNLYFHLAGIASTILIVTTNTDYKVQHFFNEHEQFGEAALPIIWAGMYIPFVTGGSLYAYGKLKKDDRAVAASFAVLQSSLVAFAYNSLLKAVTGRPNPDWQNNKNMEELSKTFRFGFMKGGIFWGWPSGHTSSAMAVVSALTSFYSEKTWLKIAGYSLVAYMMYGVSSLHRGGMHWFSDAVAAAFMSYAIGSTIGKYYRSKFEPKEGGNPLPANGMEIPLLNIQFSF